MLDLIDPCFYEKVYTPAFESSIGQHFRHIIEHYLCFLDQLEAATICYDLRQRNQRLEQDSEFALNSILELESHLQAFDHAHFTQSYQVRDQQSHVLIETSLERELLFLQSHTVHHYAIIAAITRALGIQPKGNFGVAIATRVVQKERREGGICAR